MAGVNKESSREQVEDLIHAYFLQLTSGCGNKACNNPHCATGGKNGPMVANEAAAKAIVLAQQNTKKLCITLSNKVHSEPHKGVVRRNNSGNVSSLPNVPRDTTISGNSGDEPMEVESTQINHTLTTSHTNTLHSNLVTMDTSKLPKSDESSVKSSSSDINGLTELQVMELLTKAKSEGGNYKNVMTKLWNVFSNPHLLNASFLLPEEKLTEVHRKTGITVDVDSIRRVYSALFEVEVDAITNTLTNAIDAYHSAVKREDFLSSKPLNHAVIIFENPMLHSPEFLDRAFPKFLSSVMSLSFDHKVTLVEWYTSYSIKYISQFVSSLQQLLTISVLTIDPLVSKTALQTDSSIASATHVMMIFFIANLIIAKHQNKMRSHSQKLLSAVAVPIAEPLQLQKLNVYEMLLMKFNVHPAELIESPIPLSEFINEFINKDVNMLADYRRQGQKTSHGNHAFCFLDHPYMLTPANKVEKLYFENQLSMINERHRTLFHSLLTGVLDVPFLLLRIDRNDLVNDTLAQLEVISELNPADLKKQLRVEFKGEEGIDEGGLQKEFFQLLIEKLFDQMNGMFIHDEENHFHWFNPGSLESEQQYHLIGILLGLAIYNNVILDVRFPIVVYHKLIGCFTTTEDLSSSHPSIARSLKSMMNFHGPPESFEETYMASFSVTYNNMFALETANLKDNGDKITVTKDNLQEYVDLYSDWLVNKSVAKQFNAFKKGFDLVMGDSNLADQFTAEEVELLICGSKEWDFNSLEDNTQYDGFTKTDPVIINFWEVFYEFSEEKKKQLLAFVTGSDRVPVGGLSRVKIFIVKNGPDSDRLPAAHTCFNALLLCEYSTKEKLRERLIKAIDHGKGFGML